MMTKSNLMLSNYSVIRKYSIKPLKYLNLTYAVCSNDFCECIVKRILYQHDAVATTNQSVCMRFSLIYIKCVSVIHISYSHRLIYDHAAKYETNRFC